MRKYSIYIIKNTVNEKVYIGQTCQTVKERFNQHLRPSTIKKRGSYKIYNAIEKYGKENFYYEILEEGISKDDINNKEIYYIEQFDSYNNGYNSTHGGDSKVIYKINDIDKLTKLYNENKTYLEIAECFGVNKATVQRTLNSIGLKRVKTITKEYLLENKDIKTNEEMAKELGVSAATITRRFQEYDIKRGTGSTNHMKKQNQSNITKDDLVNLIHLPNKEIAGILGIEKTYVSKLLKKYNISKKNVNRKSVSTIPVEGVEVN